MINSNEVWTIADRVVAMPAVTWIAFVRKIGVVPILETTSEEEMRDDLMLPTLSPLEIRRLCEWLNMPAPKGERGGEREREREDESRSRHIAAAGSQPQPAHSRSRDEAAAVTKLQPSP